MFVERLGEKTLEQDKILIYRVKLLLNNKLRVCNP